MISTALLAAITLGAAKGVKEITNQAVHDLYDGLKFLVLKKLGADSSAAETIHRLEQNPDSKGWQEDLSAEIGKHKDLSEDPELLVKAEQLLEAIKSLPQGPEHVQQAIGQYNALADRGSTATVNVTFKD